MAEKFLMKNETTGQIKPTYLGFSWTMLIFNIFAPLFRGDFRTFFVLIGLNLAVSLISPNMIFWACVSFMPGFIYSFFWNKEYTKRLLDKGFVFAEDENKNAYALTKYNTPNKGGYIFCAIYCILNLIFAFQFVGVGGNSLLDEFNIMAGVDKDRSAAASSSNTITDLSGAIPSSLSPYGRLADIFNIGSDYTDLQREDTLKEIKGQIVQWTLPAYEVERDGNVYTITVLPGKNVGCYIVIPNPDSQQLSRLKSIKTEENITFKGYIKGISMRHIIISPAMLVLSDSKESVQLNHALLISNYSIPLSKLKSLIKQADKGDVEAAYRAGVLLYDFRGQNSKSYDDVINNINKAIKYLIVAKNSGNIYADAMLRRIQYALALDEKDGENMEKAEQGTKQLVPILKKLGGEGITEAKYILGRINIGILNNEQEGIKLYNDACTNGHIDSCRFLGNITKGKANYQGAKAYYEKCVQAGEDYCKRLVTAMDKEIKNPVQKMKIKFDYCSGSEERGEIIAKDTNNKEVEFSFNLSNDKVSSRCDSMKQGASYTVIYRTRDLDGGGSYMEAISIE